MDKVKNVIKTILVSISFVLLLVAFAASATTAQSSSPTITEMQITTSGSAHSPAIYGDKIVWDDSRNDETGNIYMYDLSTKKETQITNSGSAQKPKIYGDRIVWLDDRNRDYGYDVYMYDLSSKKETQISTNESKNFYESPVVINGDRIVWQWSSSIIYIYDLSTNRMTEINPGAYPESYLYPDIYGNKIVWEDTRHVSGDELTNDLILYPDIYMYDLSIKKETRITTSGSANAPSIYGNRIVWIDVRKGSPGIYMYDLSAKKETQIVTSDSPYQLDIFGDRVVWVDSSGGQYNINMYDLTTKKETQITNSGSATDPAIYGNRIVWADGSNGSSNIYMCTISNEETEPNFPVAAFYASPTSGNVPLTVAFTDKSTGSPTSWNWSFGDGTTSTQKNPTHNYSLAGSYTVNLTVDNEAGTNTATKTGFINVEPFSSKLSAAFFASPTSGNAPLNVAFTDTSIGSPTSWNWNFGDGTTSNLQNPTSTYSSVGSYSVTLTVSDANGTTSSKTATIDVLEQSSSSGSSDNGGGSSGGSSSDDSSNGGSSSGGSSGSSGGGGSGGGAGGSPEPQENVETKELSQTFIGNGQSVKFEFPQKVTPVVHVNFDSKKTTGKTTTIVELLNKQSSLVSVSPSEEVYKHLNIWVGNSGFAIPANIENAVVGFKVEKSWIQDKNIDPASIALNRYSENKWEKLQTSKSGEDDSYLYFTAKTQGFSEFAITGKTKDKEAVNESQIKTDIKEAVNELQKKTDVKDIGQNKMAADGKKANEQKGNISIPGFEILSGIIGLLAVFLSERR